ncbi:efflux RND transporter permease subunit [Aestuariirhabdus litorea]|uniref:RND family transporter n=1 Tax=Aestuariirhabdus litorea TaxID=2528527 RepID=A0A3P3VRB8_9GAMM|nr:MMPL family transporter [Aestuariirhabdus litorea]RRJ84857.1 RND family transporter [Aestuariirhabdus litorea]RWW98084.1 RND family transporter [Endozoicomonadaceae bacterium GTF-13]
MSTRMHHGEAAPLLERLFFNNRVIVLAFFLLATLFLGYKMLDVRPDASFMKLIPLEHPFIKNMLEKRDDLENLGNSIRISVEAEEGDIFTPEYMEALQKINDEVFYLPGVDRGGLKSLWTANVRWLAVTEEGFEGGPVIPEDDDFTNPANLEELRTNVLRSGQVGRLVANDFKSTIIFVPLFEINPQTGERLNYQELSHQLEEKVREKFSDHGVKIHIIGFAKKVGDLIDGIGSIAYFFAMAIGITLILLYLYSRCPKSTVIPLMCSVVAVVWQLGLLATLGYGLDPYSVLVPFLVFAIGVSHGVQIINAMGIESAAGADSLTAARRTFRSLYIPGMLALVSDAIGFLTLLVIEIDVIRDLAIAASIGVAVIILTNLVLLPVLMSYIGVSKSSIERAQRHAKEEPKGWKLMSSFASPKVAPVSVGIAFVLLFVGLYASQGLKIGDLDPGAPELRPDSRYNKDNAFITQNYSTSADVMVIMVETAPEQCATYATLEAIDRYMWTMENVKGVQSAASLVTVSKLVIKGLNEGNLKWQTLSRNQYVLNNSISRAQGLFNNNCSLAPVLLFLEDHKAETLQAVVKASLEFAEANNSDSIQFKLAAGNAGIEAATNEVIEAAQDQMLVWVYGVVSLLCLITFRSIRAVICIIIPLGLTSVLCQALMAYLGIGVKVATLPVIALGVGIGVDYGIYIYSRLESFLRQGMDLQSAYYATLRTTGKAVSFTGVTLAIGVGTWIWSPIKFQADMGILLTFMFLWNMVGALWLLPALARFFVRPEKLAAKG